MHTVEVTFKTIDTWSHIKKNQAIFNFVLHAYRRMGYTILHRIEALGNGFLNKKKENKYIGADLAKSWGGGIYLKKNELTRGPLK